MVSEGFRRDFRDVILLQATAFEMIKKKFGVRDIRVNYEKAFEDYRISFNCLD